MKVNTMKRESTSEPTFFLHGGPGFSAAMERHFLGDAAGVYWWDQPRPKVGTLSPFADLVDAIIAEFSRKVEEAGASMALLANSFGAQLAQQLAARMPQQISGITLVAPTYDPKDAYITLARRLHRQTNAPLLESAATALENDKADIEKFWQLVGAVLSTQGFADLYWSPGFDRQRQWINQALADSAVFDFSANQAILNSFFAQPIVEKPSPFTGPVSIVLGKFDPLMDPAAAHHVWMRHFPQAEVSIVHAGHFPHMECPTEVWR